MTHVRNALAGLLSTSALLLVMAPARAEVNVGVTRGYPGGYGIAQPNYVAPQPFYVQPPPVYFQHDWNDGRSQWHDRQERREREWEYRHHHQNPYRHDDGRWGHSPQQDNRGWDGGQGGHVPHDGWRR